MALLRRSSSCIGTQTPRRNQRVTWIVDFGFRVPDFPLFVLAGLSWPNRRLVKSRIKVKSCRNFNSSLVVV